MAFEDAFAFSEPTGKFYSIVALSMIVVGSALLVFSVAGTHNPRKACQDDLDKGNGRTDILVLGQPGPMHLTNVGNRFVS